MEESVVWIWDTHVGVVAVDSIGVFDAWDRAPPTSWRDVKGSVESFTSSSPFLSVACAMPISSTSSSHYALHGVVHGGTSLSLPDNTPAPPGLVLPDASQRIEERLPASQGVSSLFSPEQISYFNSFVEQVRSADKDGRRQLVTSIANETLKALDGSSPHFLTRAGRSAYLKVCHMHTIHTHSIVNPHSRTFGNGFVRESAKVSRSTAMVIVGKDGRSTID